MRLLEVLFVTLAVPCAAMGYDFTEDFESYDLKGAPHPTWYEPAGYSYLPYVSVERLIESHREGYLESLMQSRARLWSDGADLEPWVSFFLRILDRHRELLEGRIELERRSMKFSPLQREIMETVREHGSVDAALLIEATGANRTTLKDNLRRMVDRGLLEKTGQRRGTRYRLAAFEPTATISEE